jgi:hypothetical protein
LSIIDPTDAHEKENKLNRNASPNTTMDHSKNTSNEKNRHRYFHSLTASDMKMLQKQQNSGRGTDREGQIKIGMQDLYDPEVASSFLKLIPYASTPPRPIFSKESQQNILKDIGASSPEFSLIANILGIFILYFLNL